MVLNYENKNIPIRQTLGDLPFLLSAILVEDV